ncbi:MAG: STAS domain-containing protein [Saccharothrix sp.]|nr:STAS domain-containing protein [Saccharothrix sp.]
MASTDGGTPLLSFDVTTRGDSRVIVCRGELDTASGKALVGEVARQCEHGTRLVVVDLSEITSVGAAGINALIAAHRAASATGSRMVAAGGPRCVRRTVDLTGGATCPSTDGRTPGTAVDHLRSGRTGPCHLTSHPGRRPVSWRRWYRSVSWWASSSTPLEDRNHRQPSWW